MDINKAVTKVAINGKTVAAFGTGATVFDTVAYIGEISRYNTLTLSPGDMIWMGADGASGIQVGDTIDISISGIGILTNKVTPGF